MEEPLTPAELARKNMLWGWALFGVFWLLFGGIWLALGHLGSAIANFLTIIGIPFGIQHLKLAAGRAAGEFLAPGGQAAGLHGREDLAGLLVA